MASRTAGDRPEPARLVVMLVSIGLLLAGTGTAVGCGVLGLAGPDVEVPFYYFFLIGYGIATLGLSLLLQTLIDSPLVPTLACGLAALGLGVILQARREAMDLVELGVGVFIVACIFWWAYQSYRGQRNRSS